jgi:hypothetical protein
VRIERNIAGVGVLAEDQESSAVAAQFHAFGDSGGMAHAFDNDIRAI